MLDANRNAVINGIVNARYICGYAEEILPLYAQGEMKKAAVSLMMILKVS